MEDYCKFADESVKNSVDYIGYVTKVLENRAGYGIQGYLTKEEYHSLVSPHVKKKMSYSDYIYDETPLHKILDTPLLKENVDEEIQFRPDKINIIIGIIGLILSFITMLLMI